MFKHTKEMSHMDMSLIFSYFLCFKRKLRVDVGTFFGLNIAVIARALTLLRKLLAD